MLLQGIFSKLMLNSYKEIILSDILKEPRKADKGYNRNQKVKVKYEDGTEAEKKYKQLKKDIEAGKCEIIDENT